MGKVLGCHERRWHRGSAATAACSRSECTHGAGCDTSATCKAHREHCMRFPVCPGKPWDSVSTPHMSNAWLPAAWSQNHFNISQRLVLNLPHLKAQSCLVSSIRMSPHISPVVPHSSKEFLTFAFPRGSNHNYKHSTHPQLTTQNSGQSTVATTLILDPNYSHPTSNLGEAQRPE